MNVWRIKGRWAYRGDSAEIEFLAVTRNNEEEAALAAGLRALIEYALVARAPDAGAPCKIETEILELAWLGEVAHDAG